MVKQTCVGKKNNNKKTNKMSCPGLGVLLFAVQKMSHLKKPGRGLLPCMGYIGICGP